MKKQSMIFGVVCFVLGGALSSVIAQQGYPPLQVLLSTSQTTLGQPITFPGGKPVITAAIITMKPKESTGKHRHDAPLFAMILEGELTVDYGQGVVHRYLKGDSFVEALHSAHEGVNTGAEPARVLAVFAGSDAVKNTVMEP